MIDVTLPVPRHPLFAFLSDSCETDSSNPQVSQATKVIALVAGHTQSAGHA
jgi:hypothetical protein